MDEVEMVVMRVWQLVIFLEEVFRELTANI